jgi:hypothetical protein
VIPISRQDLSCHDIVVKEVRKNHDNLRVGLPRY